MHGELTALDEPLPRMPPLRGRAGLRLQHNAFQAGFDAIFIANQDRVFTLETPTDGANLLKTFGSGETLSYSWTNAPAGVHVLTAKATDTYGAVTTSASVTIRVNLPLKVSTARALYAGKDLPVRRVASGGVGFLVPRVEIHEVVSLELS